MLDVGFSEILLTSAIALIVLGPERLPKVARQVGNWMGRARAMARQLSEQLEREVSAEELLKTQAQPNPSVNPPSGGASSPEGGTGSMGGSSNGAAFDPAYTHSIAPPAAAAMHASDPPVADSHAAATDAKSPHE